MSAKILDGKALSKEIKERLRLEVEEISKNGRPCRLVKKARARRVV